MKKTKPIKSKSEQTDYSLLFDAIMGPFAEKPSSKHRATTKPAPRLADLTTPSKGWYWVVCVNDFPESIALDEPSARLRKELLQALHQKQDTSYRSHVPKRYVHVHKVPIYAY